MKDTTSVNSNSDLLACNLVPRVLSQFGQQVITRRDSGIMELILPFFVDRMHHNRRLTGSLSLTLFYYDKNSVSVQGE